MYFSNMYCYGEHREGVGITGIRNCMGVVYVGPGSTYAIHIPPDSKAYETSACQTFVNSINNNRNGAGGNGFLFGFVNGTNRAWPSASANMPFTADELLTTIKLGLGSPRTALYRIMKHLGRQSGGTEADSVAVMVKRGHASLVNKAGCTFFYKRNNEVVWANGGEPPTGQYKTMPHFLGATQPSDLVSGWRRATILNCNIATI